jgi:hypothetical protein
MEADGALAGVEVVETGEDDPLVKDGDDAVLVDAKTGELDEAGADTALLEIEAGELDEAGGKSSEGPDFTLAPQTLPLVLGAPRPFFK